MDTEKTLIDIMFHLKDLINKKYNDFIDSVAKEEKKYKNYGGNDLEEHQPLVFRHFVFKSFEEVNKKLEEENKNYRVGFDSDTYNYFTNQTNEYFLKEGCIININDQYLILDPYALEFEINALNNFVKKHAGDEEIKIIPSIDENCNLKWYEFGIRS